MEPKKQQSLHDPEKGITGDCFSAVLASLLHIPVSYVPIFTGDDNQWIRDLNKWLAPFNLAYLPMDANLNLEYLGISGMFHEVAGPSPRFPSLLHSVVAEDSVPIHDPHPTNLMLPRLDHVGIFIVLEPWKTLSRARLSLHITDLRQQYMLHTGRTPTNVYITQEVLQALNDELIMANAIHILLEPIEFGKGQKVAMCKVYENTDRGIKFD